MFHKFKKFPRCEKQTPKYYKQIKERSNFIEICFHYGKKGHIKSECLQNQRKYRRYERPQKDSERGYIAWDDDMDSYDEYEKEEEIYIYLMLVYRENKVNNIPSKFTCNELFHICIKLDMDSSKLQQLVSIIRLLSLPLKNKI